MSYSFNEFAMERCEEIITKDEKCLIATVEVREASKAFFNSLSPDQQKDYLRFESIIEKKNSCHACTIYKQALQDSKSMP